MKKLIPATEFCVNHQIEVAFIGYLQETGLIEITTIKEVVYIRADQLQRLEKIIRLYQDLGINPEGIDTIMHLLQRILDLTDENTLLKNRLHLY